MYHEGAARTERAREDLNRKRYRGTTDAWREAEHYGLHLPSAWASPPPSPRSRRVVGGMLQPFDDAERSHASSTHTDTSDTGSAELALFADRRCAVTDSAYDTNGKQTQGREPR